MPYTLRQYKRALQEMGADVVQTGRGNHPWKAVCGRHKYPVTAHAGLRSEIPDEWMAPMCRRLGLDVQVLRGVLAGGKVDQVEAALETTLDK